MSITTPYEGLYSIGHYSLYPGGVPIAALSGVAAAWMINHNITYKVLQKAYNLFKSMSPSMEQMVTHPEHGAAIRMLLNRTLPGDKRGIGMPLTVEEEANQ